MKNDKNDKNMRSGTNLLCPGQVEVSAIYASSARVSDGCCRGNTGTDCWHEFCTKMALQRQFGTNFTPLAPARVAHDNIRPTHAGLLPKVADYSTRSALSSC